MMSNSSHLHLEEDAKNISEFLHKNPKYKVLFDASKRVKKEQIEIVKKILDIFSEDH